MWIHFLWHPWQVSGSPWCLSLGNTAHKNTAFWTALLGEGLSELLQTSSLFLQSNFSKDRQVSNSVINTFIINTFSLYFINSKRHFFFFLSQCKTFLYLHEEIPSSIWERRLVCACYCSAREHLLLIKGVRLSLQSEVPVQTYFSPSPSGLFQTWIFQVLNGLHSEKRPSVFFIDVQMNKTLQRRAYFTLSPFPPQHQSEWLCRRKVLWLCQTNWRRLLGLAKSCWPVTGVALHSLYPVGIICVGFSMCQRNAIYPVDGENKNIALCDS